MIRAFKLIDENSSIEQIDNNNEQCENNESHNNIQDLQFNQLKP